MVSNSKRGDLDGDKVRRKRFFFYRKSGEAVEQGGHRGGGYHAGSLGTFKVTLEQALSNLI